MVGKRLPSRNDLRMDAQSRQFSATLSRFTPLVHPKARARPAQQSRDSLGLAKSEPGLTREQRTASQKEVRSGGRKPKWERLHKSTRGAEEQARVSRPVELHHRPLAEPSVKLSPHSAPIR